MYMYMYAQMHAHMHRKIISSHLLTGNEVGEVIKHQDGFLSEKWEEGGDRKNAIMPLFKSKLTLEFL